MRAVDDLMLLLRVLEDALAAEHFFVVQAVELHFLTWMRSAVGNVGSRSGVSAIGALAFRLSRSRGDHGKSSEHLVVYRQCLRLH